MSGAALAESLAQEEAFARIRLLRSPNVGPVTYAQLLARFDDARAALDALPDLAGRAGRKAYAAAPERRVHEEIKAVRRAGARHLFHDSPDYPPLLAQADGAPPILTVRGDTALALRPAVAVVGARNASAAAVKLARDFAVGLADAGLTVVSGLARGIDGAAHRGALSADGAGGSTIGVIACGIDIAYPPEHAELQEQVAEEGLLIAEQPPGTEPLARHFPSRNRIIAGLAAGTLVVEAAPKSGSLITGSREKWGAKSWPFPAHRSIRALRAATSLSATAPCWCRAPMMSSNFSPPSTVPRARSSAMPRPNGSCPTIPANMNRRRLPNC
ncbi:hypothetical protein GCM10011494_20660 [Novosphingobium endophyticum]|uniref:Smf/DprA SLOG domain-containing protein n=1 Tax=Novosphingobium endophyticum TaxID=1955250 RepID=A0A916X5L7_9SPHN|nr:hypothetical protein GCM10011494_20660 [Novosphingobium endophyticum]